MIIRTSNEFNPGYTPITDLSGKNREMLIGFGILKLNLGDVWTSQEPFERAWLLIEGEVEFSWDGNTEIVTRKSFLDDPPAVLRVPAGMSVAISTGRDSELAVISKENPHDFSSVFYLQDDVRTDIFGAGTLGEASIRTVRTVFDGETAPESSFTLGEVINHPGKWSSYPPHDHPHPEIYHYRFFPKQGFGISLLEDQPYLVKHGDTTLVSPNRTHSQAAAPGYAMYYIWAIPHLPGDRWIPSTRYFREEHTWLLEPDVKIWPDRKYSK